MIEVGNYFFPPTLKFSFFVCGIISPFDFFPLFLWVVSSSETNLIISRLNSITEFQIILYCQFGCWLLQVTGTTHMACGVPLWYDRDTASGQRTTHSSTFLQPVFNVVILLYGRGLAAR